ncbi:MAG TPA: glycerophosphodiester phosphodiesterase family protein [Rhizomicrobium sp.]|jgi:glycerophosphoryl diester phosphodiesterase
MTIWNIAHRGGAGLRPENTLAAFGHAVRLGCDGAELDVQLSADGVAVVHHDFRLNAALTRRGGQWLHRETPRIKNLRFAELQSFDLGRVDPASGYARDHPDLVPADGARVPSLAEVAALCPANFLLLVELKSSTDPDSADPVALADAALDALNKQLARIIFVGFDWRGLARIKERSPDACCWFTTDQIKGDVRPLLDFINAAGGQGWFPRHSDVTAETAREARSRGLQLGAWTVNDPADMTRLIALGLDAICTDRPDILQSLEQRG